MCLKEIGSQPSELKPIFHIIFGIYLFGTSDGFGVCVWGGGGGGVRERERERGGGGGRRQTDRQTDRVVIKLKRNHTKFENILAMLR